MMPSDAQYQVIIAIFITVIVALMLVPVLDSAEDQLKEGTSSSTLTFTSTADFDAGTKAPLSGGNIGTETITDNPGIVSGAFELGSLKGDAFNTADADSNTAKWTAQSGTAAAPTITHEEIGHGVYHLTTVTIPGVRGLVSDASFSGNWDVRIRVNRIQSTAPATRVIHMTDVQDVDWNAVGSDGYLFYWAEGAVNDVLQLYRIVNAVPTRIGTDTTLNAAIACMRLARSGDTFTNYYSTDCSAYTLDESDTQLSMPSAFFFSANADTAGTAATIETEWDNFHLASGAVGAGGFRTVGSWTSATQASSAQEKTVEVTITYSGASANGLIDYVALFNGVTQLAIDNTDRTSGTTATSTFTLDLPATWEVRIGLAGNGAATPTMESVVVVLTQGTAQVTGTLADLAALPILFWVVGTILLIIAIVWIPLRE